MKDVFRSQYGYEKESFSWFTNKGVGEDMIIFSVHPI